MLSTKKIDICICYDQRLVAEGVASVLSKLKDIRIQGVVNNQTKDLYEWVGTNDPDLIIMELAYIAPSSIKIIEKFHQSFPQTKLLVISGLVCHRFLETLMHVIDGYLIRTCSAEKIALAINEIMESGKYLCPQLLNTLMDKDEHGHPAQNLTAREKEILALWASSETTVQIADNLNISPTTVRTHLKNIRDKFGSSNQVKMIFHACKENIINGASHPICPYCKSFCSVPSESLM